MTINEPKSDKRGIIAGATGEQSHGRDATGPVRSRRPHPHKFGLSPRHMGVAAAALLAAVALVYGLLVIDWAKVLPGHREAPVSINVSKDARIVYAGDVAGLTAVEGNTVEAGVVSQEASTSIIRSNRTRAISGGKTEGAYITLAPSTFAAFAGKRVRVTAWLRAAADDPSQRFAIAYSTAGAGNSGWLVFEPTASFADYSFDYLVPNAAAGNQHYVGFWADLKGGGGGIEVRLVTIEPLG